MSVINATPLLAAAGGDYQISRSVRLRSSASAYFNRTPGSTGNQTTWTYSSWIKRGALSTGEFITAADSSGGTNFDSIDVNADTLRVYFNGTSSAFLVTTSVYRDPSAWYHLIVAVDTTQATSSNRIKMYVNGVQVTSFSTATYPTQNYSTFFNLSGRKNVIGANALTSPTQNFDGYMTEVNFIDGQALTPSSFGETDIITGVWKPKKYAGTYGTNGFYLNFSDNSSNTATTIGKDYSGNGNNWTPNNISVTSGVTYDSMIDVPTLYADGGNGRGNYCTLNPVNANAYSGSVTISNANLTTSQSTTYILTVGTMAVSSGKWYWEVTSFTGSYPQVGITNAATPTQSFDTANTWTYSGSDGKKVNNNTGTAYGATYTGSDVIGVALDMDNGTLTFYKNNTSQGTAFNTGLTGLTVIPSFSSGYLSSGGTFNFGQRPFAYTPPTGFKALNTQNLPAPTILKGNQYFDALTWTGSNTSGSGTVTGLGFQPDFLWSKTRNIGYLHQLVDSVRGVGRALASSTTAAEVNQDASGYITSFNSNGFSSAAGGVGNYYYNETSRPYVAWAWKANGSAVTNTSGSISSQVNAGTSQGFSVVTFTGTGTTSTIGHGLGVAPKMIIVKQRSASNNWDVYHASLGNTAAIFLNATNAAVTNSVYWNNTSPTSTVFTLSGSNLDVNVNGVTVVAYCFSEVAGFSKFGSYTGNGSADGPFIFTGFRPRFVLVKGSTNITEWYVWDSARNQYNVTNLSLNPNQSAAEYSAGSLLLDLTANGFKVRDSVGSWNTSGQTYIFAAFAESPFKNSLAR